MMKLLRFLQTLVALMMVSLCSAQHENVNAHAANGQAFIVNGERVTVREEPENAGRIRGADDVRFIWWLGPPTILRDNNNNNNSNTSSIRYIVSKVVGKRTTSNNTSVSGYTSRLFGASSNNIYFDSVVADFDDLSVHKFTDDGTNISTSISYEVSEHVDGHGQAQAGDLVWIHDVKNDLVEKYFGVNLTSDDFDSLYEQVYNENHDESKPSRFFPQEGGGGGEEEEEDDEDDDDDDDEMINQNQPEQQSGEEEEKKEDVEDEVLDSDSVSSSMNKSVWFGSFAAFTTTTLILTIVFM